MVRAARKVCRYLKSTHDLGLFYSPESKKRFEDIYGKLLPEGREIPELVLFTDASFASCIVTFRSTSGSIAYFNSFPIYWKHGKQTIRANSSAEAEYIAVSDTITVSETNDFLGFLKETPERIKHSREGALVTQTTEDAVIFVDNTSAISTAVSSDFKPRSKHYALRYLKVRDHASALCYCPTELQKADVLTKSSVPGEVRRMVLHHIIPHHTSMVRRSRQDNLTKPPTTGYDSDDSETEHVSGFFNTSECTGGAYLVY
jgi:hypothetical protein